MHKLIKRIFSLLLTYILICGMTTTAFAADSSVTYEGGAENFVFLPGSEYTDTDLFDNFKGVMPGDVLQEKIVIKNDSADSDYVKIYMRAESHNETDNQLSENVAAETDLVSMQDFLKQLSLTVWNGSEMIYQASPDELNGLSENVLLGSFRLGEQTELTVQLDVPIELGNEYANRIGEVDWIFVAEELNDPETSEKPKTGDNADFIKWGVLAGAMLLLIVTIVRKRKV